MAHEPPLRIGLLGAARIAPEAMIRPAADRDDVVVVAVAARDTARAVEFAVEYGLEPEAGGYQALIEREDLDLIYVALPQISIAAGPLRRSKPADQCFAKNRFHSI